MVEYNMILDTIWKEGSWIFVQTMNSEKTTQTLPLWKRYGVPFLSLKKMTWHIESSLYKDIIMRNEVFFVSGVYL